MRALKTQDSRRMIRFCKSGLPQLMRSSVFRGLGCRGLGRTQVAPNIDPKPHFRCSRDPEEYVHTLSPKP